MLNQKPMSNRNFSFRKYHNKNIIKIRLNEERMHLNNLFIILSASFLVANADYVPVLSFLPWHTPSGVTTVGQASNLNDVLANLKDGQNVNVILVDKVNIFFFFKS